MSFSKKYTLPSAKFTDKKRHNLENNIQGEAQCQLSAHHTCQSYLLTGISTPSFAA